MSDKMLGVDIDRVRTATEGPEHTLGEKWQDPLTGYEYRYINADTAIVDGDFLTETITDADNPHSLVPTAAVDLPFRGIGISSIAAEGFGWVLIHGKHTNAKVADAAVQGNWLVSTATAGRAGAEIAFTNLEPTTAQFTAHTAMYMGLHARALTDGSASNIATVWIE